MKETTTEDQPNEDQPNVPKHLFYGVNVFLSLYVSFSICIHILILTYDAGYRKNTLYCSLAALCLLLTFNLCVLIFGLFKWSLNIFILEFCIIVFQSISSFMTMVSFPDSQPTLFILFLFSNIIFYVVMFVTAILLGLMLLMGIVYLITLAAQSQYNRINKSETPSTYAPIPTSIV